jgi:hypothetical protein
MEIRMADTDNQMPVQQVRLLEALGDLAAVAIERAQLAEMMLKNVNMQDTGC